MYCIKIFIILIKTKQMFVIAVTKLNVNAKKSLKKCI